MIKNSYKYILFVFSILLVFSQPLFAQRGGIYIGKVDLYTVALLHPAMIWYSPEKEAFIVKRDDIAKKKLNTDNKKNEEERKKLESRMKVIKARITEENKKFTENIGNLNKKYIDIDLDKKSKVATATIELNKINLKRKIEEVTAKHKVTVNSLYSEYALCEEKKDKLNNVDESFTTKAETERKFIEIINEIKAYSKRVADQKGISIVLNSGFKRMILQNPINKNYSSNNKYNYFGTIFTEPFPQSLLHDEASIRGYYKGIESNTQNWLEQGQAIFGKTTKIFIEEDILVGGVDLTSDVLVALYKAYKIDPNISNAIISSLKK